MQGRKLATAGAVALGLALSFAAHAATGPKVGPKESWDEMQKYEYYVGQLSAAAGMCNYFDLSARLKELADLTPYGRQGWRSLQQFDDLRGGRCGTYADSARDILSDRDKLWSYLTEKYDCPGGICAPEDGDDSAQAACRPEVDELLASFPLEKGDVRSVKTQSLLPGGNYIGNSKKGHLAWVRLNSCSGWLIIELSRGCHPQQSFTRGDCRVEGLGHF